MIFRNVLNELFENKIQFIAINPKNKPPQRPYATFQITSADTDTIPTIHREVINDGLDVKETSISRNEEICQIDIYARDIDEAFSLQKDIANGVKFIYRENILDRGMGILNIGLAKDNTSRGVSEVEFRVTFTITYEYSQKYEKIIENLQKVTFSNEDSGDISIER